MQNRLLNYTLFLLSPHFGMVFLFFMLDGFAVIPELFVIGLTIYVLIALGVYFIGFHFLQRWIATLEISQRAQRNVHLVLVLFGILCSYLNIFALMGVLPALLTAFTSDFLQKKLRIKPSLAEMVKIRWGIFRYIVWLFGITIMGFLFASLLGFLDEALSKDLFILMGAVGGLSALMVGFTIVILQVLINKKPTSNKL